MATEQYFQGAARESDFSEDGSSLVKWKSLSSSVEESESNPSGDFECNICLDLVKDPVVTFCGHLYCWPCIYRWISSPNTSLENADQQQPQCPVCKAEVSQKTLIPLYGRGQTTNPTEDKASDFSTLIPKRPLSLRSGNNELIPTTNSGYTFPQPHHQSYLQSSQPYHRYSGNHMDSSMLGIGGAATNLIDPMIGMFGEMVYARIFGNAETTLYTYPNSYRLASSSSPRLRRHMMQTDRSLSRVCFFLCCCVILCLLLF
ncbi:E3 ubiquitin-protein ligase RMA1H1-like [Olea europaea var. sylvestris]|uniref:E3 ubiquitin-protein ligase RMA n=1 Tax=Olea europaea subsp. europaea TaxID=158383 RepID=A0A8S0U2C8_OLEEU|nr:E3 ubiquitin-protein ligase RMA1H1-like [Olea europaea var. sylvestris]XP_022850107.1 E3 ubiquitin-protein ligase RMA1H1-like [Olea europaea var. sylvestris]CAA3011516.1 E3 ubiquitin- ligase RMA1H1-like [Olea europaea subsp. europaea]